MPGIARCVFTGGHLGLFGNQLVAKVKVLRWAIVTICHDKLAVGVIQAVLRLAVAGFLYPAVITIILVAVGA